MNVPLNFCAKCGNPRNQGETFCRFCGEPFPVKKYDINEEITSEQVDSQDETISTDFDSLHSEKQMDETNVAFENNDSNFSSDNHSADVNINESGNKETNQDISSLHNSYIKIPKKALFITLAVVLGAALFLGAFLFFKSSSNAPSKIVIQAFDDIKKKDSESFCNKLNISESTNEYIQELSKFAMMFLSDNIKGLDILEETVNDDKATVKINVNFVGGKQEEFNIHLVKENDVWKIDPLGDINLNLDTILGLCQRFGLSDGGSIDDVFNFLRDFF